ncbi:MAG: 2-C-methyl-D-erythritol 2,4-cyclodiphosphate synthase [Clostridiales bacterium]|nr:2-C-methyl-D-erythritol 2,4-cyclodiphosphate synthase [Clostridiales bacterium]OPZ67420.1 MAG: 2-C-methyl-D-erythritol 2,4-cyclodiphosphate synthase [Firmicutes bacterium ADurb.Bin467]
MTAWAVVVAAGRGERAGFAENKVFQPLGGESVLGRCLRALDATGRFQGIALVLANRDMDAYRALTASEGACASVRTVVEGGATRQESVLNGLRAVPEDVDIVAIHDAARPFVTDAIVAKSIELAVRKGSGVCCAPVVDTIKHIDPETGRVRTLDRADLRAAQTPQTFRREAILRAYERARELGWSATDDADIYERHWGEVCLFEAPGAALNIKLTTREDFLRMSQGFETRIGIGYDAHRLKEGRALILCGAGIPHEKGLDGHSDADVAAHALMDALLGAIGEGDIGRHFPDADAEFKGISSMLLLARVMRLVREKGYRVVNADVVIAAQRPKLAPFIEEMRLNLAEALGVGFDCANVKATTTERMGFEGREEGISAQAAVLLSKGGDRA